MSINMQSIYVLAGGGSRAMEQLDIQANNLANVNTPGFKKLLMTEMSQRVPETLPGQTQRLVFPRFSESRVLQHQGALIKTDSPNDVALSGSGFLEVRRGNETLLTRQGKMQVDTKGLLVDNLGGQFLDAKGKVIRLDTEQPFTISKKGTIFQEGEQKAQLGIAAYATVLPAGEHYYRSGGGTALQADATLNQGFLESSNLNPTEAMVGLIESQRRFDIYGRLIRSLDQLQQKANEIGRA